jgi:hypothetical protein
MVDVVVMTVVVACVVVSIAGVSFLVLGPILLNRFGLKSG